MNTISLVMIVKNESEKLKRCLNSVHKYVDEMIVTDTGSTDNSIETARSFNAKVYHFDWVDDFSKARNFALSKASSDYILVLDSDDYLASIDLEGIKAMHKEDFIGEITIMNSYVKNDVEEHFKSFASRFFPRGIEYRGRIHEQLDSDLKRIKVPIEVIHDGYKERSPEKAERNLKLLLMDINKKPSPYLYFQISREYAFFNDYVKENEYLKKCYSVINKNASIYPELIVNFLYNVINTKEFETGLDIIKNNEAYLHNYPDFLFVCGVFYADLISSNPQKYIMYFNNIEKCYKKCIEIGDNHNYSGVSGTGSFSAMHNLAAYYEVIGDLNNAEKYYKAASDYGYSPSINRLKTFTR